MLRLSRMIASLFYVGFIPGMPGTYGSILTALVYWGAVRASGGIGPWLHLEIICLLAIVGVAASAEISRKTGLKDPSFIIIDEAAGQMTTLLLVPATGLNIVLGIVAFRLFDIWKPYPIRKLERPGMGIGVMADDLLAGIYGNVVLQIINLLL